METQQSRINTLVDFIRNPQIQGAWSLRIDLDEPSLSHLTRLLNIQDNRFYSRKMFVSFRAASSSFERNAEMPAIIIPRLFAYLRACLSKPQKEQLPDLAPRMDDTKYRQTHRLLGSRSSRWLSEFALPPTSLGSTKKKNLSHALKIYLDKFSNFTLFSVPDIAPKLDCVSRSTTNYFQLTEEPEGVLKVLSPSEDTILDLKSLFENIKGITFKSEQTKIFSPESSLMEMYLPILSLIPPRCILKDKGIIKNVLLALEESRAERYTHSIRAAGIGSEEVLVEVFESFIHEKAPEAPLGNLISDLNSRINMILSGGKKKIDISLSESKKTIGKLIDLEKNRKSSNKSLLGLMEDLQKSFIPFLENLKESINEIVDQNPKVQRIALFPSYVYRCLSELVTLRNRVSHRIEKGASIASVGYVESAFAIRALIVLANWWQTERSLINYKHSRKTIITQTIERSKQIVEEVTT